MHQNSDGSTAAVPRHYGGSTELASRYTRLLEQLQHDSIYFSGVEGKSIHFYGNNGVCVFKYLVTPEDPQKIYSLTVLAVNFVCFIIISGCYLLISIRAARSSENVAGANNPGKRNTGLQAKISAIIFTDFLCWIPLIVICFLHYGEVINAAEWYPVFSITLLPFNSVINPVLYNANIASVLMKPGRWIVSSVRSAVSSIRRENRINDDEREEDVADQVLHNQIVHVQTAC